MQCKILPTVSAMICNLFSVILSVSHNVSGNGLFKCIPLEEASLNSTM